jgi:hypothetical protein
VFVTSKLFYKWPVPASGSLNGRLQALSENKILDYPEKLVMRDFLQNG